MSTITTSPVIGVAVLRIPVVPESDTHAHNAQHAQVVHQHVNVDVPESFSAKNIQVSPNGTYVAGMPAGIVTEFATVTGKLDVIDDAYINVQPDPDKHETSVLVGFDYNKGQTDEHTGVYVHRNHDIIVMSHKDGIRAPKHLIEGHNMEAIHFDAQHEISAGHKINVPEIHTSRISPYPGNKNHPVTIVSALIMEKGGINASNLDLKKGKVVSEMLSLTRGDIVCRNLYATGTVKGLHLFEHYPKPLTHEDQGQLTKGSVRLGDNSLYIGLMRRSYDRATHKPVTHILKRQIPTYLVAQGFVLADIPSPFTVDNMTIHNWIVLAQGFMSDTTNSIEIDTVFPSANTADWEDYISPVSIDLDAAEVEIDALDTRITALEAAGGGGGELSTVTIVTATANDQIIYLADNIVGLVLVKHANLTGVECVLPETLVDGDIILVKNYNTTDGGDNSIKLTVAWDSVPVIPEPLYLFDDRWTSIQLNASSTANANPDTYANQCARLLCKVMDAGLGSERKVLFRLNDSY